MLHEQTSMDIEHVHQPKRLINKVVKVQPVATRQQNDNMDQLVVLLRAQQRFKRTIYEKYYAKVFGHIIRKNSMKHWIVFLVIVLILIKMRIINLYLLIIL